jgi:transposase
MATTATAVGIDVGDRISHWCALDKAGEVVGRGRMRTTAEAVTEQAQAWRGARVALENGTHSGWMSRALTAAGCETTVANPSRWRGTAHMSKNDRNDAEALARVGRGGRTRPAGSAGSSRRFWRCLSHNQRAYKNHEINKFP